MEIDSRSGWQGKGALEELMRERIRATIETIVEEELEGALGAARSQRVGSVRVGYRHGKRARTLTTSLGATTITIDFDNPVWPTSMLTFGPPVFR
jgi:transposase-like protein